MNLQPMPEASIRRRPSVDRAAGRVVFFDSLESGLANFSFAAGDGSPRWYRIAAVCALRHEYFLSRVRHFPVDIGDMTGDGQRASRAAECVHAFRARVGLRDTEHDGGVVEDSTNGGTSWIDVGGLFDADGYRGALAAGLAIRSRAVAFVAASHGYVSTRLTLAPLAGQNARFRWRLGLYGDRLPASSDG